MNKPFGVALVLTATFSAAVGFAGRNVGSAELPEQIEEVYGPAAWVPVSAKTRRVHDATGQEWAGRFYRGSDGSIRSESGATLDTIDTIGINNIAAGVHYLWSSRLGWTAQPLELPPTGWNPPTRRRFSNAWTARASEGFDMMIVPGPDGRQTSLVPELNFLDIVKTVPCTWTPEPQCGTWYYDIVVGEPS